VSCKESVEVSIIGSPLGTQTEVKVGLDAKVFENYKTLMEEFQLFKKQYEDMSKDLVVMSKIDNINNMPEFKKKSYIKTLYEAKHIQEAMKEKQALIMSLKTELDKYKYSGKIVTESIVYPGVNVQLGNAVLAIRDQLPRCRFTNEEGRVKVAYNF
ncbi:FapA family protein, partial [Tyzzerella sp. OttesenSCG-928-J15]|nr:FapA family protein [Tyzzerella sp. OttesenSCG-928-J15]